MNEIQIKALNWQGPHNVLPVIIQNAQNGQVLMLGYMNHEALIATVTSEQLTLFNLEKNKLWRAEEVSTVALALHQISTSNDNNSLLIQVIPQSIGALEQQISSFHPPLTSTIGILDDLMQRMEERAQHPDQQSYTTQILNQGATGCAKKVGNEAIAVLIAALSQNEEELIKKSADLIYHLLLLLKAAQLNFYDVLMCINESTVE